MSKAPEQDASSIAEVEITGVLDPPALARLRALVGSWTFEGRFDRYLINFTTPEMRAKKVDVRARVTNGNPEIVVKYGEWGSGKRVETNVRCERGQFTSLVKAMVAMGLSEGVGCHRVIDRYRDDKLEVSIIEVPGYKTFYEAELQVPVEAADAAMSELQQWATKNGFQVFDKKEYLSFIEDLDANANDILSFHDSQSWDRFRLRVPDSDDRPIS